MNKAKPKFLLCDRYMIRPKEGAEESELELTLEGCKTNKDELLSLMSNYASRVHENEPSVINDVQVNDYYMNKVLLLGRNQQSAEKENAIFFYAYVMKNKVVFEFYKGNSTENYLKGFCISCTKTP